MQPFEPKPGAAEFEFDFDDATPIEIDDKHWDALMPDDDELDPLPEPGVKCHPLLRSGRAATYASYRSIKVVRSRRIACLSPLIDFAL